MSAGELQPDLFGQDQHQQSFDYLYTPQTTTIVPDHPLYGYQQQPLQIQPVPSPQPQQTYSSYQPITTTPATTTPTYYYQPSPTYYYYPQTTATTTTAQPPPAYYYPNTQPTYYYPQAQPQPINVPQQQPQSMYQYMPQFHPISMLPVLIPQSQLINKYILKKNIFLRKILKCSFYIFL